MLTINTENVTLIDSERGPSGPANPRLEIEDSKEEGYLTVSFKFDIAKEDRWSLSVSKGVGDEKQSFGFGQGSTHQERPEQVIAKAMQWMKEERERSNKRPGVITMPPSFWEDN